MFGHTTQLKQSACIASIHWKFSCVSFFSARFYSFLFVLLPKLNHLTLSKTVHFAYFSKNIGKVFNVFYFSKFENEIKQNVKIKKRRRRRGYLKASKSYQCGEGEARQLVIMKTEEAREKQKVARRKTRMRELKRRSFCTVTVEWK